MNLRIKNVRLIERVIRNDDIFCSVLLDQLNRTIRVVDFRGGNFQAKHTFLEQILTTEGMRKIFTLIERDDVNGWQRVGYQREGAIPGYYKRSDAYIVSRIYDPDYDAEASQNEESPERKNFFAKIKTLAKEMSEHKSSDIRIDRVGEAEALEAIKSELRRAAAKSKAPKTSRREKALDQSAEHELYIPIFPQFSRGIENFYFAAQNRRTKQINLYGAEYQDCFGNAKIDILFSPVTRIDQNLSRGGLIAFVDTLVEMGVVSVFTLTSKDDLAKNALYASAGFRNTGWLNRQLLTDQGAIDQILWTRKLI